MRTRQVSLNELNSDHTTNPTRYAIRPKEALLGTLNPDGTGHPEEYHEKITENPHVGDTEIWEIHNFTADAHPIHLHQVHFEVLDREVFNSGTPRPPEPWESGVKDTVISYPGEITRIKAISTSRGCLSGTAISSSTKTMR